MQDDDFPELRELLAAQARRHRRIIIGLIVGGLLSIVSGLVIFALAPSGSSPSMGGGAVGVMAIGVGVVLVGRGIVSAVTDIDLRPRGEFESATISDVPDTSDPGADLAGPVLMRREPDETKKV